MSQKESPAQELKRRWPDAVKMTDTPVDTWITKSGRFVFFWGGRWQTAASYVSVCRTVAGQSKGKVRKEKPGPPVAVMVATAPDFNLHIYTTKVRRHVGRTCEYGDRYGGVHNSYNRRNTLRVVDSDRCQEYINAATAFVDDPKLEKKLNAIYDKINDLLDKCQVQCEKQSKTFRELLQKEGVPMTPAKFKEIQAELVKKGKDDGK